MGLAAPRALAAILLGGLLLVWPAFLNGYPILFSDTGAFLAQTVVPLMIWDKPWVYGPLLALFHWNITLWGPLLAQGLMLSHLLWLVQRALRGGATPGAHLLLLGALATLTALPWVAALLMPDVFTPVVALALFLLARALRPVLAVAAPLAVALLLLLGTNWVGHGRLSLSPYGSTFMLARMIGDGTAARTVEASCPQSGWYLCAWAGRLPGDSDEFLWLPDSPLNRDAAGQPIFLGGVILAPEARAIVAETLRREPLAVALAALRNFGRQLLLVRIGDTLSRDHLGGSVRPRLVEGFPSAEVARYDAAAQPADRLPALAAPLLWPQVPVLLLGAAGLAVLAWRLRGPRRAFALFLFAAVAANALAAGALSKPHHRYQARIVWLLPFGAAALVLPRLRPAAPPRDGAAAGAA